MAVDNSAVMNQILEILQNLDGLNHSQIGMPESWGPRVGAAVTLGSQNSGRKTTGTTEHISRYFVLFVYRVDKSETTAETELAQMVDGFIAALHADLTLAGAVKDLNVNSLVADTPEYQLRAGKEFREYPVLIECTQHGTYAVNP